MQDPEYFGCQFENMVCNSENTRTRTRTIIQEHKNKNRDSGVLKRG